MMVTRTRMARAAVRMGILHGAEEIERSGRCRGRQTDRKDHDERNRIQSELNSASTTHAVRAQLNTTFETTKRKEICHLTQLISTSCRGRCGALGTFPHISPIVIRFGALRLVRS